MSNLSADEQCYNNVFSDLRFIGLSCSQKGFSYLCLTILFAVQNPISLKSIKANLIPKVANYFNVKIENVERSMRHCLDAAYFKNTLKKINELLGFNYISPYEKPSLTNFISVLTERNIILYNKMIKEERAKNRNLLKSTLPIFTPPKSTTFFTFPQL